MITKKIEDIQYVVFDIETTGFKPETDQMIEIGAVKINKNGEKISSFHKFVSLYKVPTIPKIIEELTKIDDKLLEKEGNPLDEVMKEFKTYIEDCMLVAQNAKFDMSFIDDYFLKEKQYISNLVIDTIDIGKNLYPSKKSYKLASLMEYFEIKYDKNAHHRADYDAEITAKILIKGLKEMETTVGTEIQNYKNILKLDEASIKQKRFLFSLLEKNEIIVGKKCYLTKFNAMRQISILQDMK